MGHGAVFRVLPAIRSDGRRRRLYLSVHERSTIAAGSEWAWMAASRTAPSHIVRARTHGTTAAEH